MRGQRTKGIGRIATPPLMESQNEDAVIAEARGRITYDTEFHPEFFDYDVAPRVRQIFGGNLQGMRECLDIVVSGCEEIAGRCGGHYSHAGYTELAPAILDTYGNDLVSIRRAFDICLNAGAGLGEDIESLRRYNFYAYACTTAISVHRDNLDAIEHTLDDVIRMASYLGGDFLRKRTLTALIRSSAGGLQGLDRMVELSARLAGESKLAREIFTSRFVDFETSGVLGSIINNHGDNINRTTRVFEMVLNAASRSNDAGRLLLYLTAPAAISTYGEDLDALDRSLQSFVRHFGGRYTQDDLREDGYLLDPEVLTSAFQVAGRDVNLLDNIFGVIADSGVSPIDFDAQDIVMAYGGNPRELRIRLTEYRRITELPERQREHELQKLREHLKVIKEAGGYHGMKERIGNVIGSLNSVERPSPRFIQGVDVDANPQRILGMVRASTEPLYSQEDEQELRRLLGGLLSHTSIVHRIYDDPNHEKLASFLRMDEPTILSGEMMSNLGLSVEPAGGFLTLIIDLMIDSKELVSFRSEIGPLPTRTDATAIVLTPEAQGIQHVLAFPVEDTALIQDIFEELKHSNPSVSLYSSYKLAGAVVMPISAINDFTIEVATRVNGGNRREVSRRLVGGLLDMKVEDLDTDLLDPALIPKEVVIPSGVGGGFIGKIIVPDDAWPVVEDEARARHGEFKIGGRDWRDVITTWGKYAKLPEVKELKRAREEFIKRFGEDE